MGSLVDFFRGLAGGARAAPAGHPFERMCADLEWRIAARPSAGVYELHFDGGRFGARRLLVSWGDGGAVFALPSAADVPESRLPRGVGCALLVRNNRASPVAWRMCRNEGGGWGFAAAIVTLTAGMDAAFLRHVCSVLCEEVAFVDGRLSAMGVI